MIEVALRDPLSNKGIKIVNDGAMAVLPPHYNKIFSVKLEAASTVYNVVPAKANQYFVTQTIILTANKNVGVNDATVSIYVGVSSEDTLTTQSEYLTLEMPSKSDKVISDMNLITEGKGVWINAVTDDDDVYVTLLGYYTDASI